MSNGVRVGWVVSILFLLFTGCVGLYNGITEWSGAETGLQKSVTAGVFVYGVLGVTAFAGLILRKEWSVGAVMLWGIVVTYVAGAAVIAYSGPDAGVWGALIGSVATAIIAAFMIWIAIRATQPEPATKREPGLSAPGSR